MARKVNKVKYLRTMLHEPNKRPYEVFKSGDSDEEPRTVGFGIFEHWEQESVGNRPNGTKLVMECVMRDGPPKTLQTVEWPLPAEDAAPEAVKSRKDE